MRTNLARAAIAPLLSMLAVLSLAALLGPLLTSPAPAGTVLTTAASMPAAPAVSLTFRHPPEKYVAARPVTFTVTAADDTLTGISAAVYGTADAWYLIAEANHISSPYWVSDGQALKLPAPRRHYPQPPAVRDAPAATTTTYAMPQGPSSGDYSYSGLEALWEANGGSASVAATAACIAEHESSGNPSAFNGTDIGLWQVDPANEPGADLYDASVNAAEAVRLSQDGTVWVDWQTAPACDA
jgi:Lysozyme like domain/LysM domain